MSDYTLIDEINYRSYTITIHYDEFCESPREWDNITTFACAHKRYSLPNECNVPFDNLSSWRDVEDWIYDNFNVVAIKPLYMYDHGGITINTEGFSDPWDSGQIGFVFVERSKLLSTFARKKVTRNLIDEAYNIIDREVDIYRKYVEGNVYSVCIFDSNGNRIDGVGAIYDMNDAIKYAKEIVDSDIRSQINIRIKYLREVITKKLPLIYRKQFHIKR